MCYTLVMYVHNIGSFSIQSTFAAIVTPASSLWPPPVASVSREALFASGRSSKVFPPRKIRTATFPERLPQKTMTAPASRREGVGKKSCGQATNQTVPCNYILLDFEIRNPCTQFQPMKMQYTCTHRFKHHVLVKTFQTNCVYKLL